MIGHRCKNCIWWDNQHESIALVPKLPGKPLPGFCRKHKPGAIMISGCYSGIQPVIDGNEFCGEFKGEA